MALFLFVRYFATGTNSPCAIAGRRGHFFVTGVWEEERENSCRTFGCIDWMNHIPWIPSHPSPGKLSQIPNTSYTTLVFCTVLLVTAAIVSAEGAWREGGVVLIFIDIFGDCGAMICRVVVIFFQIYRFQAVVCHFPPFDRRFHCC